MEEDALLSLAMRSSSLSDSVLVQLLSEAIDQGSSEIIDYVLRSPLSPEVGSQVLQLGAMHSPDMLEFLLSYETINPMFDVRALAISCNEALRKNPNLVREIENREAFSVLSSQSKSEEERMQVLVRHRRIILEEVDVKTLRLLVWGLREHMRDSIAGYVIATALTEGDLATMKEISIALESNLSLFRTIMLKGMSPFELVHWMIDRRDRRFVVAARCILQSRTSNNVGTEMVRALLLSLLYPTLGLQEALIALEEEGLSGVALRVTAQLLGAYLGESGIHSRV